MLRWIDEINGITDADGKAIELKTEIRRLRKEEDCLGNRRQIGRLYERLDAIQFKPDYMCLIIDSVADYRRACSGFWINGVKYVRLLGTNGGVKDSTIVFVSERVSEELRNRIDNGRDQTVRMVPAKFEAYRALTCSASIPVSMPRGVIVVNDCETRFMSDVVHISDECDGEPVVEERRDMEIEMNASDGYGLMLPSLAERWAMELELDYVPGGMNTRFAWEKGVAVRFDFLEFADRVAGSYAVKDAWGVERDVRDFELILTTSMVKLWDSYGSLEEYMSRCEENGYRFGISKVAPESLEDEHCLNYQFLQSYELSDDDIDELIAPTVTEIKEILCADYRKTVLYLKGVGMSEKNIWKMENDYVKAMMIEPRMLHDPFVQSKLRRQIQKQIDEAKVGVVKVRGNYSIACGDPYSLCQSIFGLEVTGLMEAGEVYNSYWDEADSGKLVCFRAPMTGHNNIRAVTVNRSEEARYWYRHIGTCTAFNSWDTCAMALNGMD
jgi:hypothetical protein